jgi:hypothetical protein
MVELFSIDSYGMWNFTQRNPDIGTRRPRRTAASQFIQNGGNIFALQKLLGHVTPEKVRHYVDLASEDVSIAHQKASPMDGRWL